MESVSYTHLDVYKRQAAIVYAEIQKTDVLTGAKYISFAEGVEKGLIRFVGDDCKKALYEAIESRQVRPGLCKTAGLKLVYSPLNGCLLYTSPERDRYTGRVRQLGNGQRFR